MRLNGFCWAALAGAALLCGCAESARPKPDVPQVCTAGGGGELSCNVNLVPTKKQVNVTGFTWESDGSDPARKLEIPFGFDFGFFVLVDRKNGAPKLVSITQSFDIKNVNPSSQELIFFLGAKNSYYVGPIYPKWRRSSVDKDEYQCSDLEAAQKEELQSIYNPCASSLTRAAKGARLIATTVTSVLSLGTSKLYSVVIDTDAVNKLIVDIGLFDHLEQALLDKSRASDHTYYLNMFSLSKTSLQFESFIQKYRGNDPDNLVPIAQERLLQARKEEDRKVAVDKARAAEAEEARRQFSAVINRFRSKLQSGDDSHCGLVVEDKPPVASVQTMIGIVWFRTDQLYPVGAVRCQFMNGQYVPP